MLDITFYKFGKNENSTKTVNVAGETFKCALIEPTDIINPRIALAHANPTAYNYARIPIFNRYYFVNNWSWSGGRWVALLNVDVLASWKADIGRQSQYVVRSSARHNGEIIDTLYPADTDVWLELSIGYDVETGEPFKFSRRIQDGTFVVGIVNSEQDAIGTVSYYAFTNDQFRAFCNKLMGSGEWMYEGIQEIGEELTKVLFNPFQYIASCIWLPFTTGSGAVSEIKYGWWTFSATAKKITGANVGYTIAFDIPKHPQISRGSYLNCSPFTRRYLDWPCFGRIALDATILDKFDKLSVDAYIDTVSGVGTLRIAPGVIPISTLQTQIGVPIQMSQMAVDYGSIVGSAVNSIQHAARLDIGGAFASIGDAVASAIPQMQTVGKNGSISAYRFNPVLVSEFYTVVDEDNEHRGRPLMEKVNPSTIPGYILCSDAELECNATSNEISQIKAFLNGGFYYE